MVRKTKLAAATLVILSLTLAGCDKARKAAEAINRYAISLDAAQKVEIEAHKSAIITNDEHRKLQQSFIRAAQAGKSLNHGLVAALQGGDPKAQLDAATQTLDALINDLDVIHDADKRNELKALMLAVKAALQNAITLIQAVKGGSQ